MRTLRSDHPRPQTNRTVGGARDVMTRDRSVPACDVSLPVLDQHRDDGVGAASELACSLSPTGLRDRKRLIDRLLEEATGEPSPIHGGAQARFPRSREIEQQLRGLVALEAECCAFLSLTVHTVHDAVILEVTGPPGSQSVITALFATSQM